MKIRRNKMLKGPYDEMQSIFRQHIYIYLYFDSLQVCV